MEKHDLKPLPPVNSAANDLKQTPLWWETAPRERDSGITLPRSADIVIIGAGYTGLSCALALARAGRSVIVIDSSAPGFGASSRSGGMVGHGHRLSYAKLEARYGTPKARAILREGVAAFDFTIGLIERERIDAKFARVGRFRGCATASDYEASAREAEPGPPVVSISTTRETPKALGLLHEVGMAAGIGDLSAALSATVTTDPGARPSVGVAWGGAGAGTGREAFCKRMAPKTATQSTIASADAIAARRMSDLQP